MMGRSGGPTPHAQPFYCPYCGEEDFLPFGEEPDRFLCNSCTRHFVVRFLGLGTRPRVAESREEAV